MLIETEIITSLDRQHDRYSPQFYEAIRNASSFRDALFPSTDAMRLSILAQFQNKDTGGRFIVSGSDLNLTSVKVQMLDPTDQAAYGLVSTAYLSALDERFYTIEQLETGAQRVTVFNKPVENLDGARALQMELVQEDDQPLRATIVEFIPQWRAQ